MSHVVKLGLQIKDMAALKAACLSLGLELVEAKDFRYYAGMRAPCNYAIRIPGDSQAYEIGVIKNADHYELQWDTFAGGKGMVSRVGQNSKDTKAGKLRQAYASQVSIRTLQRQGYRVAQSTDVNGNVVLRAN